MKNLLAFECANFSCSAAVLMKKNGLLKTLAFEKREGMHGQGALLIPLIQNVLRQANMQFHHLNAIAVTTGPGSFTGVRIGLAAAYGLKLALGIPLMGVDSFKVAASKAVQFNKNNQPLLVVLESRRQDKYCQLFDADLQPLKPAAALLPAELCAYTSPEIVIAGNGYESFLPPEYSSATLVPMFDAVDVGGYPFGHEMHETVEPYYLRQPDITVSNKK